MQSGWWKSFWYQIHFRRRIPFNFGLMSTIKRLIKWASVWWSFFLCKLFIIYIKMDTEYEYRINKIESNCFEPQIFANFRKKKHSVRNSIVIIPFYFFPSIKCCMKIWHILTKHQYMNTMCVIYTHNIC